MKPASDDTGFSALTRTIEQRGVLCPDSYKPRCLRRRIAVRMRAHSVESYEDYLAILERDPGEYEKLADALTINVTNFFRNPEFWKLLRGQILPELFRASPGSFKAWSAGCASGEEPYSLMMALAEAAEDMGRPGRLQGIAIDATDIDRKCLERATAARYPPEAFRDAPPELVKRYTEAGEEFFRVVEPLRSRVRVSRLDLHRDQPVAPPYDLIFCRNVLIYFDRAGQDRIFNMFADALGSGGMLVLGKVETILGPVRNRFEVVDLHERIYRRIA